MPWGQDYPGPGSRGASHVWGKVRLLPFLIGWCGHISRGGGYAYTTHVYSRMRECVKRAQSQACTLGFPPRKRTKPSLGLGTVALSPEPPSPVQAPAARLFARLRARVFSLSLSEVIQCGTPHSGASAGPGLSSPASALSPGGPGSPQCPHLQMRLCSSQGPAACRA